MKLKSHFFPWGILFIICVFYALNRARFPGFGDSLGFLLFGVKGFDFATNATSHFLYANFNHIAISLFSFINPVTVLTWVSILFSLGCAFILYKGAFLITKNPFISGIVTFLMAFSFTWWRQSIMIEVYAFYCFWVLISLYFMLSDLFQQEDNHVIKVGISLGLGILTHIQAILFLPVFGLYLWQVKKNKKKSIFFSIGGFLLAISPLFLLPIWLKTHSISSVFFDNQYQDAVLSFHFPDLIKGGIRSIGYLFYNFHLFAFFIFHGIWISWKKYQNLFWFGFITIAPIWGFAMRYNVSDNYVFFIIPYFILCISGGISLEEWRKKISDKALKWVLASSMIISPIFYVTAWQIAEQIPAMQNWAESKEYKGGLEYYLWPGLSNAKDPLEIAEKIYREEIPPIPDFERYPVAIEYLKYTGRMD